MSSMSQRLSQHPRYLALLGTLFLGTVYFLYQAHSAAPKMQYTDLLAATKDLSSSSNTCGANILPGAETHLALTLQGSERRYQRMIGIREKFLVETGVIPNTAFSDWRSIPWDFFIPEFTCPHPMYRVGTVAEGGKWVCGLERVLHSNPNCIVYSLNNNSASYSSFEVNMLEKSPACQVHAFDLNAAPRTASSWPWGDAADNIDTTLLGSRVHFNRFALANPTVPNHHSLKSVMGTLGHEWIDILKVCISFRFLSSYHVERISRFARRQIELNGSEFATLLSIIAEYGNKPLPFGQLVVTIQALQSEDMTTMGQFHQWWQRLECAGLRPVYFELGMMDINNRRQDPGVSYWTFINVRGTHALIDDTLPEYP
ncbi:Methyltranfer-dom domain-containing protein [Mycena sanguinolenta]|uniref:Methyltranfer-dom domain-containing protein n=1 Tax=Mycena sanguinolenta TaxID=230812 RepID=A0A8H6YY89_9AGAR|nr:Methyltranfer-dom domain-containing protein [Mycena sanguinolenta]